MATRYLEKMVGLFLCIIAAGRVFAGGAPAAGASQPAFGELGNSQKVLLVLTFAGGTFTPAEQGLAEDSLVAALMQNSAGMVVLPDAADTAPEVLASRSDCDMLLSVGVSGDSTSGVAISYSLEGRAGNGLRTAGRLSAVSPTGTELTEIFWIGLVDRLAPFLASGRGGRAGTLTVTAIPGSRITGAAEQPVTVRGNGMAVIPVRFPATLRLCITAVGYYREERDVFIDRQDLTLQADQVALPRWRVDLGMMAGQFPEVRASWFNDPGTFFLRFGITQYCAGLTLFSQSSDFAQTAIFSGVPLVQPGWGFGFVLSRPDERMRYYLSFYQFMRLFFTENGGIYFEPIAPVGFEWWGGVEYALTKKILFFLEGGPTVYICTDPTLMAASLSEREVSWPTAISGRFFYDFVTFRAGIRICF